MSRIRGKDTKPEILVRKGLHARGFRFRLQDRKLPGRPDVVLPKYGVAIMVNGCFWHGHEGCRYATKPKSNIDYWLPKIAANRHRDEVTVAHLEALGWHVITIWECELRPSSAAGERMDALADEIRRAGQMFWERKDAMRRSAAVAKRERKEALSRLAALEAEVDALYSIPGRVRREAREGRIYSLRSYILMPLPRGTSKQ